MVLKRLEQFQLGEFRDDYRLQAILAMIPDATGTVLDIGSGNGEIAISLSKKAKCVYATENSGLLLKNLGNKLRRYPRLKIKKIDAENFYMKGKSFDLITACDVMEHLKNDTRLLRCCYKHLKNRGKIFISVPAIKCLYGIRDEKYGHYRRYRRAEIIDKIENAGFAVIRCQYWNIIGVFPYFISEKIFNKEINAPSRRNLNNFFSRTLNRTLYYWLILESKINLLPFGLSLIIVAQKNDV